MKNKTLETSLKPGAIQTSAFKKTLTLRSLFDGIGGFPLAGLHNGIEPVWASEIETFPIEVTRERFPDMLHVGDITKLNGNELPPVDIITGGSPCQDLSVAGAGLALPGNAPGYSWSRFA